MDVPRTLVVTNDYPPRVGGIQRTLEALVRQFPPDRVAVLCPAWEGSSAFDAAGGYRVFRQPERFLWPTPDAGRRIRAAVAEWPDRRFTLRQGIRVLAEHPPRAPQ